ncbi:MAG: hypothetical protein IPI75_15175 [Gammaproteobacteria bacterium]|nr:hypothetical protein [Gammaproteobacteria bacterium]
MGGIQSGRLYWQSGNSGNPPPTNTGQYIDEQKNRCASSYDPLNSGGYFIDRAAMWQKSSSTSWSNLSTGTPVPLHMDCRTDVSDKEDGNGSGTGAPGNGYPRSSNPRPYGNRQTSVDDDWNTYRFYTANYMNWYYSTTLVTRTRIEVAQDVVTTLISGNPGIDFGLAVFNYNNTNNSDDGGRIVRRIKENMSTAERSSLVTLVNDLDPETWTPLCESTYEAYRYLAGKTVKYGNNGGARTPAKDSQAESSGTYISPAGECEYTYVILMTDGLPTRDTNANSAIESLTGKTCKSYATDGDGNTKNCLPEIAEYMYTTDLDGDANNGDQKAITYTIGFQVNQTLLSDAAAKGGGLYYTANSATELADAFHGAVTSILSTSSSFTSPSVAVNTFTRTESRNEVFFAMFQPRDGTDWPGNIKKLGISISGGTATLVDADGAAAINGTTGGIADTARTYWSSGTDGATVDEGGVGALLAAKDPATRVIKTNTGSGGALQDFVPANITHSALGLADDAALFNAFGVPDQAALTNVLDWARGYTDSTKTETRGWILGDMLHGRPLVLNYGARGSYTTSNPDLRIVVGTNAGFLHMFGNSDGQEDWAFFPKELAAVLEKRRDNQGGAPNVYGIDSPLIFYSKDLNNDGTIDSTAGDKLYVYFGLRRGGKAYYALDISNPDNPVFLWQIDKSSSGFGELGQSWSVPVVTYIPGYASGGVRKPVLVFAAGYDATKDDKNTIAGADSEGRGVFIVDAVTGAKIWSVTPAANDATNMQVTGMQHSMPAGVAVLDSNGDEMTDRIYVPDTGGNVWRIDMPGNSRPTASQTKWMVTKMATLNTASVDGHAGDRRFFSAVDVVRTSDGSGAFDAVMIGSGDRTNPNSIDNDDRLYMLRDNGIEVYSTAAPSASDCSGGSDDYRCVLPLTDAALYDATLNHLQDGTDPQKAAAMLALSGAHGWYIDLNAGDGEKALARSLTIAGKSYFTTFSPDLSANNICEPAPGTGRLYVLSVINATAVTDFTGDNVLGAADRLVTLGSLIPDTPAPHFGSDKKIRLLFPSGGGVKGLANPLDTGAALGHPYGSYWYNQEF